MGLGAASGDHIVGSTLMSSPPASLFGRQVGMPGGLCVRNVCNAPQARCLTLCPNSIVTPARWTHPVKAVARLARRAAATTIQTIALAAL